MNWEGYASKQILPFKDGCPLLKILDFLQDARSFIDQFSEALREHGLFLPTELRRIDTLDIEFFVIIIQVTRVTHR